jgi:hypothetical protein
MPEATESTDEYSMARKLVLRAAKRENALNSITSCGDGGPDNALSGKIGADFSSLRLKPDHIQRPCWTCPDGNIYLEAFHDLYLQATNIETESISISVLDRLS